MDKSWNEGSAGHVKMWSRSIFPRWRAVPPALAMLVASLLGSEPLRAAPTIEAQRAALVKQSVARQGMAGQDVERQRLVGARRTLDARSVTAHGALHRRPPGEAVAGNSASRRTIASASAAQQHVAAPPHVAKPLS